MAKANPTEEAPVNISISAYRVLFILLMLVRYRSLDTMELNRFLVENPLINRAYNSETLTKYINTLREVGCQIPRSSSRNDYSYELLKNPFPLSLNPAELAVAEKLLTLLSMQSDDILYHDYQAFLEQLFWAVDTPRPKPTETMALPDMPDLTVRRNQLNLYRRYCQESYTLEINYRGQEQELLLLEPYELIERDKQLLLLGLDRKTQQQKVLNIEHIGSAKQLPSKNRRPASYTVVVFALYDRLAKSYRLYPNEKVIYRSKNELQIKTKVIETSGLVSRLLKYGSACQILSPDSLRDHMKQHVSNLLHTLLTPTNLNPEP